MKKPIVAWASDLHINAKYALRHPELVTEDGDISRGSKTQDALWEAWVDAWDYINSLKTDDREVVAVFGGEIAETDAKNRSWKLHSRNPNDIMNLAWKTILPALIVADKVIVIRGTEAHSGIDSHFDERVARRITTAIRAEHSVSHYHDRFNIGGYKFDLAHHVSMGNLPWTKRNAANKLAAKLIMQYVEWGEDIPDFAIRGHVHRKADSGLNFPIRVLVSPGWVVHGPYNHRIGVGAEKPEIGLVIVDTETGEAAFREYEPRRTQPIEV